MAKEMVNHPGHYEKGNGHPECIELMTEICEGYSGIAAFDIGQIKYNYRVGSKEDADKSMKEKMVEDASKYLFYLKDFQKRAKKSVIPHFFDFLPEGFVCEKTDKDSSRGEYIANEFIWDKPENLKQIIATVVKKVYCLKTYGDLEEAIEAQTKLVEELKK